MKRSGRALAGGAACAALLYVASVAGPAPALADVPLCAGRPATIVGSEGPDEIRGTSGDDVIVTLGGNDYVNAGDGDDRVCGGDGRDRLTGGGGADRIFGGPRTDRIYGTAGDGDYLGGQGGADQLELNGTATGPADHCVGGQGDDNLECVTATSWVEGGSGDDWLVAAGPLSATTVGGLWDGGEGADVLNLRRLAPVGALSLDLSQGTGSADGVSLQLPGIERAAVRATQVELLGSDADNYFWVESDPGVGGLSPRVSVSGGGGDDGIVWHADTPASADLLGGADTDSVWIELPTAPPPPVTEHVWIDLVGGEWGTHERGVLGGIDTDVINVNAAWIRVAGTPGPDLIRVAAPTAEVTAGAGDDQVLVAGWWAGRPGDLIAFRGGPGDDVLTGGIGRDALYGGAGDDVLAGLAADDLLFGGRDLDRADGGGARDHCRAEVEIHCERD